MTRTQTQEGPASAPVSREVSRPAFLVLHCGKQFLPRPRVLPLHDLPALPPEKSQPRRFLFGRAALESLGLQDSRVSGRHFALWQRGDGNRSQTFVEDLGSKNHLFVDGDRLPFSEQDAPRELREKLPRDRLGRAEIHDGALLRCGDTLLLFRSHFSGALEADAPVCDLQGERIVSPFGLRKLRQELGSIAADFRGTPQLSRLNILLLGETGCGKELLARHLAALLGRPRPFTPVNIKAIPPTLFTSEFFGIENLQGSPSTQGLAEANHQGTLFLDEIHCLDPSVHGHLLRFLETRDFQKVGSHKLRHVDVLVLTAASQDLGKTMGNDIKMRLENLRIIIPSLRERAEDIPEICKEMLRRRGMTEEEVMTLPVEVELMEALLLHPWNGNARELRNTLEGLLRKASAPRGLWLWAWQALFTTTSERSSVARSMTLRKIVHALRETRQPRGYNFSEAARLLSMDDTTLRRWIGQLS